MKWRNILKSKYDIKDIDLQNFHIAGSNMKYFLDKHGSRGSAADHLQTTWERLIMSILRHGKMRTKDRIDFKRVASAKGVNVEQSRIYDNIGISGSKIIKPMFPIPLDLEWGRGLFYNTLDNYKTKRVFGELKVNTEGTELIIKEMRIPAYSMTIVVDKVISLKKPDRELSNFLSNLQKDGKVLLKVSTDMKYKNGTKIKIKPYIKQFYIDGEGGDYGKIMAAIRRDAVIGVPKKTLFEERVEEEKLSQRDNLWAELRDTYMKPLERWRREETE